MAATEVNARWQAEMAEFFVGAGRRPARRRASCCCEEVFHLEDQLAALEHDSETR